MDEKREIIATQLRMPAELYADIRNEASGLGVSINSHMLELIHQGQRLRKAEITVVSQCERQ